MSKKSRRRNKKILGALAAIGLGLAAKNKRNKAIDTGIQSAEDDKGSDMMEFKEQVVSTPIKKPTRRDSVLASPVINKMDTSEVTIPDNYFKKPSKVIREPITFGTRSNDGLSYFKKGGRVGCGKAKRGFGRAMMKGKK